MIFLRLNFIFEVTAVAVDLENKNITFEAVNKNENKVSQGGPQKDIF